MPEKNWLAKAAVPLLAALMASSAFLSWGSAAAAETPGSKAVESLLPLQTAVLAGGCFWGVDAVFKHVKGVAGVESGYAGGGAATAHYDQVSNGDTGHAESVRIRFDPARLSYRQILEIFFSVAHDPTQRNRQGPDVGSQYRSAIFFTDSEQQKVALKMVEELTAAHKFAKPIVTQIVPLSQFFPAESYHQNYLALHPHQPYILFNDMPKLEQLRQTYPALYQ